MEESETVPTKFVEWIQPFGPNSEPVYMRVAESTAIAVMKKMHSYESDERALEEFIVVHWAERVSHSESETVPTEAAKPTFEQEFMDNMRNTAKRVRENPEIYSNFRVAESETVKERAQFEKWAVPNFKCGSSDAPFFGRTNGRRYAQPRVQAAWEAWQARADLASSLLQEKEQRIKELEAAAQSSRVVIAALLNSTKWELSHTMLSELRHSHDKLLTVLGD